MNDIQLFKNERFGEVRVAGTSDEPLFCLADICRVLEIKNVSDCKSRLDQRGGSFNRGGLRDYKSVWNNDSAKSDAYLY